VATFLAVGLLACAAVAETGTPQPPAATPLKAEPGVTALSGTVLDTAGKPLEGVLILDDPARTWTDDQGRFLLTYAPSGESVLRVDGRHTGAKHLEDHGIYEIHVSITPGETNNLPFSSYLPLIDHKYDVSLQSPTTGEVIIKSPSGRGVEIHIPAGIKVLDADGRPVTRLGVTTFPRNRAPFPLPDRFDETGNFTVQPGGSCLVKADGSSGGAQIWYPNSRKALPRSLITVYRYDVAQLGWTPYGVAAMDPGKGHFVPDSKTMIHDFDGECPPHPLLVDLSRHEIKANPAQGK
jgi:hypothetical protein